MKKTYVAPFVMVYNIQPVVLMAGSLVYGGDGNGIVNHARRISDFYDEFDEEDTE